MVEFWSIADIKERLKLSSINVGDKYYCHSKRTPEFENYFTIVHLTKKYISWHITDIRNSRTNEYVKVNHFGNGYRKTFVEKIRNGDFVKL